jgi:hypothetical protein
MLRSKSWGGDTVAEGVGRHGIVAILKLFRLSIVVFYGHRKCARKEGKKKKIQQRASHWGARHNTVIQVRSDGENC